MYHKDKMVIGDVHERLSTYDLEGSFDQLIARMTELKERCAKLNLLNARLDTVCREYGEGVELAVVYDRKMNEPELELLAENEQRNAQYRRAEYERLKKEFGDK